MSKARDLASGQNGVRPYAMEQGTGTVNITTLSGSWYYGDITVTFTSNRFSTAPAVYASHAPNNIGFAQLVTAPTSTGATLRFTNNASVTTKTYHWVAIQMTPTTLAG